MSVWKRLRAVLTICTALGWWGMWFPELAVWTDAVCVVAQEESAAVQSEEYIVEWLLHADREQILVKSRLLEWMRKYMNCN